MHVQYDKKRLRIGLISYRSNPHSGGQGVYLRHLSRALKDLGHHVEILCGPPGPHIDPTIPVHRIPCLDLYNPNALFRMPSVKELCDPVNFIEWLGVSTMGFPEPFTFGLRIFRFLRDKLHHFDVLHDNQCLSYGIWALSKLTPTVITIHHPITVDRDIDLKAAQHTWEKFKYLRWYSFLPMQKRVTRQFGQIITVSESARNDISSDFGVSMDKFRVVPNGINTDLFHPLPEIKRKKNHLIVTNSADTPLKGLRYLLIAVAQIAKTRPIRLTVIGTPKKDGDIIKLISHLGIRNLITFTGRIDDAEFIRQYARATMAIIPSVYEGFGLPAGEAMACGVPVISTTGGALPEVVGDAGLLVPPKDHRALAQAITTYLDHPQKALEMGHAGYKRVLHHFTWKIAAQKTIDTYREAICDYCRP